MPIKLFRYGLCLVLTGILLFVFPQGNQPDQTALLKQYKSTVALFEKTKNIPGKPGHDFPRINADTYHSALIQFQELAHRSAKAAYDSLAFHAFLHAGTIALEMKDDLQSKHFLLQCIRFKNAVQDTVLFAPYVHLGGTYERGRQFDSANHWYSLASRIMNDHSGFRATEQQLGSLAGFYEASGQFTLATISLEKILDQPGNAISEEPSIRLRLGLLQQRLQLTDAAVNNLKAALPYYPQESLLALAGISLETADPMKALDWLQQLVLPAIPHEEQFKYHCLLTSTFTALGQLDSASHFLDIAFKDQEVQGIRPDKSKNARLLKLRGDIFSMERRYQEATDHYQLALTTLVPDYKSNDFDMNSADFTGIYDYTSLFRILAAKADALEKLYHQEKEADLLLSSLSAYRSAWALADYVTGFYTPDIGKQFTRQIKQTLRGKSVGICLSLYELTRKKSYLEEAWLFAQRNRLLNSPISNQFQDLLPGEIQLRTRLSRLLLQTPLQKDSVGLLTLKDEISLNEKELNKIRTISRDPGNQIAPVKDLQKKLDNSTALLSYHLSESDLLLLVVTASQLDYYKTPVTSEFFSEIASLRTALQQAPQSGRYNGTVPAMNLFETLLLPVYGNLSHIKRLVIIPDGALHGIPFEALQDGNKEYLVEKFSVQYQYTHSLPVVGDDPVPTDATLSFAPFSSTSFTDTSGNVMPGLPVSGAGLLRLNGKNYRDSGATKANFLNTDKYPVLHLSTYAAIRDDDPSLSHITFYPGKPDFRLYAPEIGKLDLHEINLLMIDAAETGPGGLITGKGLIQFTRTFAEAGCPDMMLSLWRTEDKVGAFIMGRIHEHLDNGYSRDRALRQAKLDLINSREIDSRYLNPGYWGNIIFIGEYDADHAGNRWRWVALGVVGILLGYFFIKKRG